jgi:hypothetical protein
MTHRRIALLAALAIAGCGGGLGELVAIVPIVGPIGGAWQEDTNPDTAVLEADPEERILDLNADDSAAYLIESNYTLTGQFQSSSGDCAGNVNVVGEADDDRLVLRRADDEDVVCLDARFTDLRTLEAEDGRVYRNTTVQLRLRDHEWVNVDNEAQRIKFTRGDPLLEGGDPNDDAPLEGCRRTSGGAPDEVTGTLEAFSADNTAAPRITDFRIGSTTYGTGTFNGASEIEFNSPKLTLRRVRAGSTPVTCP